jgi:hypothetical protein
MQLRHPFESLSISGQKRAFILFFVLTIELMAGLQMTGVHLSTDVAPQGIISFEFAGELALAQRMVESWGQKGQVYAGLNIGLDYLFLVVYACAIALGCVLVARGLSKRNEATSNLGIVIAWAQFLAALLDGVENYGLIQILVGMQNEVWPVVAKWCAWPKFLIVGVGLIYVVVGTVLILAFKAKNQRDRPA